MVNIAPLSSELAADRALIWGCVVGAAPADQIGAWLAEAGFDILVEIEPESRELIATWASGGGVEDYVTSVIIEGRKPSA